ncbi:MAG: manganese efflux pump MntP family protein [Candidatus Bathyarchaeota archaeon]|nr:manganese efflux pump MntP family protein [Candidatus Bathyarchaeota archaeon]
MDALTIHLIAVGLAMDAFAVSIASGLTIKENRRKSALLTATAFGSFQMIMPVIGYAAGLSFESIITSVDHWVAFGLLAFIGAKMFYDGIKKEETKGGPTSLKLKTLLVLVVATSIDALMVGLSFAFLQVSLFTPIVAIGVVTFGLSLIGFYFGCGLGQRLGHRIKIVGGIVLILIGLRILLEHLFA